ncbi:MAG: nitronate monooxygenase, partial [Bacteroidota bacterium]|nr:nitronate monooxygenase [Bacteroidota bacterium]
PKDCRMLIRSVRAMTDKPFAVNLVLAFDQDERINICIEEQVPVVIFSWGDGVVYAEQLKAAGILLGQTVCTASEAVYYEQKGADFLVAQGWEAGGYVLGKVTTMVLVPAIAAQVSIPFAAAGGIANGKGILAALTLGASGVSIGTRFMMSEEAEVHTRFQQLIARASESDTVYSERLFNIGWDNAPHRIIRNSTVNNFEKINDMSNRPGEGETIAYRADKTPIERYSDVFPLTGMTGDIEAMALYAGQSAGLVISVQSVSEIMNELVRELKNEYQNLTGLFKPLTISPKLI